MYDFDYFVIGAGSGGVRSARIAAGHGARVGIAEERYLGGTCVNAGCIPKKLMVYASRVADGLEEAPGFGWTLPEPTFRWETFIVNKDKEISRLTGVYRRLLEAAKVRIFESHATLIDAHTIAIGDKRVSAEKILLATGSWPYLPNEPGVNEHAITSNEAMHLPKLPKRIIIVGGGYIGVELAGIFNGFGSKVTQLHRGELLLHGFDNDVRQVLAEEMIKRGIDLRLKTAITKIEKSSAGLIAHLDDQTTIECDVVLYATGRKPHVEKLGLAAVGVMLTERGSIAIDAHCRTNVENIYALGDVTDRINLTPVAIAEGHALADSLFGNKPRTVSLENVASAVFSDPPVATVGLTEETARGTYADVAVFRSSFRPLKRVLGDRKDKTLMKLVVDSKTDRVLGIHMVGLDAPEIMQGFAVALNCGVTKAQIDATIGIHPTSAEEFVLMS